MKIMNGFYVFFACVALCFIYSVQVIAADTQGLPVRSFSVLQDTSHIKISPHGNKILCFKNSENNTFLISLSLETMEMKTLFVADNVEYKLKSANWVNNDMVVFSIKFPFKSRGTTHYNSAVLVRKADASESSMGLIDFKELGLTRQSTYAGKIISMLPNDPDHVLMSMHGYKGIGTVYKINVYTRDLEEVQPWMEDVYEWVADQQGSVRAGLKLTDTSMSILVYDLAEKKWNEILKNEINRDEDFDFIRPKGFGIDPDILYIQAKHNDRYAIFKADISKPDMSMDLIAKDEDYDITGSLLYSIKTGDAVGVYHDEAESGRIYWDKGYKKLQASIDKALPDTTNYLVDLSDDEQKYIIFSENSTTPGIFFLGDREKNTITLIAHTYPQLEGKLQGSKKVSYTTPDGKEIEAYLYLPAGYKPGTKYPAVIFPENESIINEQGYFDYWSEYFSSKGIIVFRPNLKYYAYPDLEFVKKAANNFAPSIKDDLTNAAIWLIEQNLADPERIAIAGKSYGGYAALMGAIETPDLFRCAISFAGISDLPALLQATSPRSKFSTLLEKASTDRKNIKEISPANNVDKIKIPVFLAHGDVDTAISVKQSREMAKQLKKKKKVYTYVELEDGDHGLTLQKNRHLFFKAMDEFLNNYLLDK